MGRDMPDMPEKPIDPPLVPRPPSPESLEARAKRVKSQALHVGTTRLIQESRYLREQNERMLKEAEKLKSKPKVKERAKKTAG
jgi:hypothetical protein